MSLIYKNPSSLLRPLRILNQSLGSEWTASLSFPSQYFPHWVYMR